METMSLEDVCKLLKIDVSTGRNRLSGGAPMPPSFRVGRRRLFLKDEVELWLREQPKSTGLSIHSSRLDKNSINTNNHKKLGDKTS